MAFASLCILVVSLYHHSACNGFLFRINRQDWKIHICKYFIDITACAFQITFDRTALISYKYRYMSVALISSGNDTFIHEFFGQQQTYDPYLRFAHVDELLA